MGLSLTVLGAGVAGSALTRLARENGHSVRLVAAESGEASRAALAVLRPQYLGMATGSERWVSYAVGRYSAAGCRLWRGAFTTRPGGRGKHEPDWWAVEPDPFLLSPDRYSYEQDDWVDPLSDFTVHATGARLDEAHNYGVTWWHPDPEALRFSSLRVHRYAPYRTLDAVAYPSGARLGSSAGKTQEDALSAARKQFELAAELGWLATERGWEALGGARGKRAERVQISGRRVLWGGFWRNGFALAPWEAAVILERLLKVHNGEPHTVRPL